jgi:hypothetical protein
MTLPPCPDFSIMIYTLFLAADNKIFFCPQKKTCFGRKTPACDPAAFDGASLDSADAFP